MIKKRIKIQFKKAVSMFMGAALPGIMCTILLSVCLAGCKSIPAIPEKDQAGENQRQEQMKESKDTDPGQEKKLRQEKIHKTVGKAQHKMMEAQRVRRLSGTVKCLRM